MGCCYSFFCKEDNSSQGGDPNERTRLLADPVSNNPHIQRVNSEEILNKNSHALPKKTDEQSALNRILQETATNVIDVAALDSHNLQQHEYLERMKIYSQRTQQVLGNNRYKLSSRPKSILEDIPNPDVVFNSEPINFDDLNALKKSVAAAAAAINDIKVDHKEDLVVPFGLN